MKHVRIITKNQPISAYWWNWFGQFGELKLSKPISAYWWNWFGQFGELKRAQPAGAAKCQGLSFKGLFVNALWNTVGSLDPRDV